VKLNSASRTQLIEPGGKGRLYVAGGKAAPLQVAGAAADRPPLCRGSLTSNPTLQCIGQNRTFTAVPIVGLVGDLFGHCRGQPVAPQVVQEGRSTEGSAAEQFRRTRHSPGVIVDVAVANAFGNCVLDRCLVVVALQKALT